MLLEKEKVGRGGGGETERKRTSSKFNYFFLFEWNKFYEVIEYQNGVRIIINIIILILFIYLLILLLYLLLSSTCGLKESRLLGVEVEAHFYFFFFAANLESSFRNHFLI